jgi:hypothetical protein
VNARTNITGNGRSQLTQAQ